ncbi:MAG: hypothetical protein AAGA12_12290 [Pseudomonadota bacterium]
MSATTAPEQDPRYSSSFWGLTGFLIGAAAFILVLVHHYGGPFTQQPEIGVTIGEIAADIKETAIAKLMGEELPPAPPPSNPPFDYDRLLKVLSAAGAGLAVVAGLGGLIRREDRVPALAAIGLGASAIVFQWLSWLVLLIAGVVLITSILQNLGNIFDPFSWFGG